MLKLLERQLDVALGHLGLRLGGCYLIFGRQLSAMSEDDRVGLFVVDEFDSVGILQAVMALIHSGPIPPL